MTKLLPCIAVLSLLSAASAQRLEQNIWRTWDRSTEGTSRGNVNNNVGWLSQAIRPAELAGVTELTYIKYVVQDQDQATVEPWDLDWTGQGAAGLPDYGNARNSQKIVTNNALPRGTGIGAWLITHNLNANASASFKFTPSFEPWHLTWHLKSTPPPNWPRDGLGIHMSSGTTAATNNPTKLCIQVRSRYVHREIPRTEMINNRIVQPNTQLAWSSTPGTPARPPSSTDLSWRLDLGTNVPVISVATNNTTYNGVGGQFSCPNPNEGYAGLFPDFNDEVGNSPARFDDPHWLVNAGSSNASGDAVLLMSTALGSTPVKIPGWSGSLFLDLNDPLTLKTAGLFILRLDQTGSANFTFPLGTGGRTNVIRPLLASFINWHFQVAVISSKGANFSKLATMTPTLNNKRRYRQGMTARGRPIFIVSQNIKNVLVVRNDGHGELTVNERNGRTILKTHKIPEGSAVRIRRLPRTNSIEIVGSKRLNSKVTWNWES